MTATEELDKPVRKATTNDDVLSDPIRAALDAAVADRGYAEDVA